MDSQSSSSSGSESSGSDADSHSDEEAGELEVENDENVDPNTDPNPEEWWSEHEAGWFADKTAATKQRYQSILTKFKLFLHDHAPDIDASDVAQVKLQHMTQWKASMTEASNDKIRKYLIVLKSFWKWLFAIRVVVHNWTLALRLPPKDKRMRQKKFLSHEKINAFLEKARDTSATHVCIFGLLYYAGLRISELVHLKVDDIEVQEIEEQDEVVHKLRITVRGEGSKNSKMRQFTVGRTGTKYMKDHIWMLQEITHNEYLFPSRRVSRKKGAENIELEHKGIESVYKIVKKYGKHEDIEVPKVTPHWFRHACASHAKERGNSLESIRDMLGHSDTKTTDLYIQSGQEAGDH